MSMSTIRASVLVYKVGVVMGEGGTQAEADENLLLALREHVRYSIPFGARMLPRDVVAALPVVPQGFRFLVLECTDNNDDQPFNWRVFAVTTRSFAIYRNGRREERFTEGNTPLVLRFSESSSEYVYTLPRGSMEYVSGSWIPRRRARYTL